VSSVYAMIVLIEWREQI